MDTLHYYIKSCTWIYINILSILQICRKSLFIFIFNSYKLFQNFIVINKFCKFLQLAWIFIIFVTNKCQIFRSKVADFDCCKASAMGEFLPAKLGMEEGECPIFMKIQSSYPETENFVYIFENGKGVRVPASSYETKGNRKKLINAYSAASPICAVFYEDEKEPFDILLVSAAEKAIVIKTSLIPQKATRTSGGVTLMTLKKNDKLSFATANIPDSYEKGYKKLKIPASGVTIPDSDLSALQLSIYNTKDTE